MKAISLVIFACIFFIAASAKRQNIIIILADDMGYSDIGCYGSEIETPNLDYLASQGLRYKQFYNAARCCPSRASILTGLYPHQAGVGEMTGDLGVPAYRGFIKPNATTIAEQLGNAGYDTFVVGKWHLGESRERWPDQYGFDRYFSFLGGAGSFFNLDVWSTSGKPSRIVEAGKDWYPDEGFYMTTTFTDKAVQYINERDQEKPFFMYLAYTAPHWPLHALPEDIAKYKGRYLEGWDKIREKRFERLKEIGLVDANFELPPRNREVDPWESIPREAHEEWDIKMAIYAAMVDSMDRGIGEVMQALEEQEVLEDTVIFFLSDNGGCHEEIVPWSRIISPQDGEPGSADTFISYDRPWANVSNTPFDWYKSYNHEGGIATPLVAFAPGIIDESIRGSIEKNRVGHIIDLLPTCLEIAGVDYPAFIGDRVITPTPGRSLIHSFSGNSGTPHHALFWEHMASRAVREGDWKLVANGKSAWVEDIPVWELYNLKDDPFETQNVAGNYPERVEYMQKLYDKWADEVGVLEAKAFFEKKRIVRMQRTN